MDAVTEDLGCFWIELAGLLEAGKPLLSALRAAQRACVSPAARSAVAQAVETVAGGSTLSDALQAQPEFFGPGAMHVMRGGEYLGMIDRTARLIADASQACPDCAAWRGARQD